LTKDEKTEVMSPKAGRILCATDLSNKSASTYRYALQKAREINAKVLVCHVISQRSIKAAKRLASFFNENQKDIVKEKKYYALQRMKKQLSDLFKNELKDHPEYADLIEYTLVYHGNIAEKLAEKAILLGCDAIVLGSHRSNFAKLLFPCSMTNKILNQTKKPTLLASMKKGNIDISPW